MHQLVKSFSQNLPENLDRINLGWTMIPQRRRRASEGGVKGRIKGKLISRRVENDMNIFQRIILGIGVLSIICMILFPPWGTGPSGLSVPKGYSFVASSPPRYSDRTLQVNFDRLLAQTAIAAILTAMAAFMLKGLDNGHKPTRYLMGSVGLAMAAACLFWCVRLLQPEPQIDPSAFGGILVEESTMPAPRPAPWVPDPVNPFENYGKTIPEPSRPNPFLAARDPNKPAPQVPPVDETTK